MAVLFVLPGAYGVRCMRWGHTSCFLDMSGGPANRAGPPGSVLGSVALRDVRHCADALAPRGTGGHTGAP